MWFSQAPQVLPGTYCCVGCSPWLWLHRGHVHLCRVLHSVNICSSVVFHMCCRAISALAFGAPLPLPYQPTLTSAELFLSYLSLLLQLLWDIFWENMFSQRHLVWEAQLWLVVSLLELAVSNREAQISSHADTYLQRAGSQEWWYHTPFPESSDFFPGLIACSFDLPLFV